MFRRRGDVHGCVKTSTVLIPPDDVMLRDASSDHQGVGGLHVPRQIAHHLLIGQGVDVEVAVLLPEHEQLGSNGTVGDARDAHRDAVLGRPMDEGCLLYTSPSPRDLSTSRMPSSA